MPMPRRIPACLFALTAALFAAHACQAGSIRTRDGQVFEGDVQLDTPRAGWINVSPPASAGGGLAFSFPLSDIASLSFKPPITGVLSGGTLAGDWAVADVG